MKRSRCSLSGEEKRKPERIFPQEVKWIKNQYPSTNIPNTNHEKETAHPRMLSSTEQSWSFPYASRISSMCPIQRKLSPGGLFLIPSFSLHPLLRWEVQVAFLQTAPNLFSQSWSWKLQTEVSVNPRVSGEDLRKVLVESRSKVVKSLVCCIEMMGFELFPVPNEGLWVRSFV